MPDPDDSESKFESESRATWSVGNEEIWVYDAEACAWFITPKRPRYEDTASELFGTLYMQLILIFLSDTK